MKLLSAQ